MNSKNEMRYLIVINIVSIGYLLTKKPMILYKIQFEKTYAIKEPIHVQNKSFTH